MRRRRGKGESDAEGGREDELLMSGRPKDASVKAKSRLQTEARTDIRGEIEGVRAEDLGQDLVMVLILQHV